MRTTFIAMFLLLLGCGGILFAISSFFSRDAQMRSAQFEFEDRHQAEYALAKANAPKAGASSGAPRQTPAPSAPQQASALQEEPLSLDSWYADAGTSEEPFDPTPEDDSYLINDAQPFVTVE